MRGLINYLGCGNLRSKREVFEYQVSKYSDLIEKIIPFFKFYPLRTVKLLNFNDFLEVSSLMREGSHLTLEGLEKIKPIKEGMNSAREFKENHRKGRRPCLLYKKNKLFLPHV